MLVQGSPLEHVLAEEHADNVEQEPEEHFESLRATILNKILLQLELFVADREAVDKNCEF